MEQKFLLGQTVYSAQGYKLGRYTVVEFLTHETKDGVKVEYIVQDPMERKEGYSEEDIEKHFFATIEEAKVLALQDWAVTASNVEKQIANFSDVDFDIVAKKMQEKKAEK